MRSLLNIIKASEYDGLKSKEIKHLETSADQQSADPVKKISKTEIKQQHQAIVNDAFKKAKDIVEAAQNYSLNQLKESTTRMNEECAQMKVRSYDEGYRQGLAQGKKEGNELGYRTGCEEGYQEGLRKTEEERIKIIEEIKNANEAKEKELLRMLAVVEDKKSEILERFESNIEGLAVTIAQKVIRKEISIDEKAMQAIIFDVLDSYRNQEWIKISVCQSTANLLTKADRNIAEALKEISNNVKIVPAPELKDGDCQIELPDRLIDAGIDTQMDCIKAALNL